MLLPYPSSGYVLAVVRRRGVELGKVDGSRRPRGNRRRVRHQRKVDVDYEVGVEEAEGRHERWLKGRWQWLCLLLLAEYRRDGGRAWQ